MLKPYLYDYAQIAPTRTTRPNPLLTRKQHGHPTSACQPLTPHTERRCSQEAMFLDAAPARYDTHGGMRRTLTISFIGACLAVAGCGGGGTRAAGGVPSGAQAAAGYASGPVVGPSTASVAVRTARGYGKLLVDGSGRTLYLFTHDLGARSRCSGACAKAWPPLIVSAKPGARAGVQGAALGVTRRADKALQATYHGHPLYYFAGDNQPGQINCQDAEEFGGHWWLIKPSGAENRATL